MTSRCRNVVLAVLCVCPVFAATVGDAGAAPVQPGVTIAPDQPDQNLSVAVQPVDTEPSALAVQDDPAAAPTAPAPWWEAGSTAPAFPGLPFPNFPVP